MNASDRFRPARVAMRLVLLLLAAAVLLPASRPMHADTTFQVGYEEVDITPPLGGSMPGYFRDRRSTAVLDPLMAKVLYFRRGETRIALVACDLIGMGAPLVERIRGATATAARAAGEPPPGHLWVHCSHTHTGAMPPRNSSFTSDAEQIYPAFYPGDVDHRWVDQLVEKVAGAVIRAGRSAAPEDRVTLHTGEEATVAHYRRYLMKDGSVRTNPGRANPQVVRPAGRIDPRLHLLRFGARRIAVGIYGCHPDCVGGTAYSADYPHHFSETLRRGLGEGWRVVFLNACSGNINHINVADPAQKSGPEEARRIGETLARAALASVDRGRPLPADRLAAARTVLTCRLRRPGDELVREAEERLRTNREPFGFNTLYAPAVVVLAKTRDREHPAEIAALRLGDFGLAAMPGEIFVELGRDVEEGSPFQPTRTLGLTNGSMGYIPTLRGYEEGGYEAGWRSARYEPDTGHRWAAAAARLLRELQK